MGTGYVVLYILYIKEYHRDRSTEACASPWPGFDPCGRRTRSVRLRVKKNTIKKYYKLKQKTCNWYRVSLAVPVSPTLKSSNGSLIVASVRQAGDSGVTWRGKMRKRHDTITCCTEGVVIFWVFSSLFDLRMILVTFNRSFYLVVHELDS